MEIDKNMGNKKINITKDQFLKEKQDKLKSKSLEAIQKLQKAKKNKLNTDDELKLVNLLSDYKENKIDDVLMLHFIEQKIELEIKYKERQNIVKDLQMKLLEQINDVSNDVIETKNNLDYINISILNHLKK